MNQTPALALINEELPIGIRSQIVQAVKKAYAIVDQYSNQLDWLNWIVGADGLGYLRRIAVEFQIKCLIDNGKLPFDYYIRPNAIDNCRHIELKTRKSIITISQVQSPGSVPRKAVFRNNSSLRNQLILDFDDVGNTIIKDSPFYILLTHGYQSKEPKFVCLGVPEPQVTGWIDKINLLTEPHEAQLPEVERIEREDLVALKEHVKKVMQHGS